MLRHLQKIAISVFGSFDGCSKIQKDESMKYLFISKGMVVFFFVILYTKSYSTTLICRKMPKWTDVYRS